MHSFGPDETQNMLAAIQTIAYPALLQKESADDGSDSDTEVDPDEARTKALELSLFKRNYSCFMPIKCAQ